MSKQNEGDPCSHSEGEIDTQNCSDCVGSFGNWTPCDPVTEKQSRSFSISIPQSGTGTLACDYAPSDTEEQTCKIPIDCKGEWGAWQRCSRVREGTRGQMTRNYTIIAPAQYGGNPCPETDQLVEYRDCALPTVFAWDYSVPRAVRIFFSNLYTCIFYIAILQEKRRIILRLSTYPVQTL